MKMRRLKVLHSAHDNSVSYLCIGNYDAAFTTKYLGVCIVSEIGQVSSYYNSDEKAGSYSSMEMVAGPMTILMIFCTIVVERGDFESEFRGCSDLGNIWPVYSSNLPVLSGYGASRSEVNCKSFASI